MGSPMQGQAAHACLPTVQTNFAAFAVLRGPAGSDAGRARRPPTESGENKKEDR